MNPEDKTLIVRLLEQTKVTKKCWLWQGNTSNGGYGKIRYNGKAEQVHRLSMFAFNDFDLNSKEFICHKCDVPNCINPDHLFIGTHQDNMTDMANKGRAHKRLGENNASAKLKNKDAVEIIERLTKGESCTALAREFKVSKSLIHKIKQGKNWKWLRSKV